MAAQNSPVYKYVKKWKLALPLHPEFRTLPMLFYVPSLLPVMATVEKDLYELGEEFFGNPENSRVSSRYLASLFTAGDEGAIISVNKKLLAVRMYRRSQTVGDLDKTECARMLDEAGTNPEEVEEIYQMSSLATFEGTFRDSAFHAGDGDWIC